MNADIPHRLPRTIAEMRERIMNSGAPTPAERQKLMSYKPDASDVFIVTPPKCGTTWMQQIVHGLRTRGSMEFDDISRVVPWIDMSFWTDIDIYAPQVAAPRAFKTHLPLDRLPVGGNYIVVLRDPADALLSHYRFVEGVLFEKGCIDITTWAREQFFPPGYFWKHILSVWNHRNDSNLRIFFFEDMKADLVTTIERVAQFINIHLDTELKQIVLTQSDIQFMRQHQEKFDGKILRESQFPRMKLPMTGKLNKVRTGNVGDSAHDLPAELKQQLLTEWQAKVTSMIGISSYENLRKELGAER